MKYLILFTLIISFAKSALACQELIWSPSEYALNSTRVYISYVSSISIPTADKPIDINTYVNSIRIIGDIKVSIKILKSLKGEEIDMIQIPLNWCRGGQYDLGDLVAVYKLGDFWHVKNTKSAITQTIKALTRHSS